MKGGYIHPITIRRSTSTGKKISSNERRRRLTTKIQTANKRNVRVRVRVNKRTRRTRRTQFGRR